MVSVGLCAERAPSSMSAPFDALTVLTSVNRRFPTKRFTLKKTAAFKIARIAMKSFSRLRQSRSGTSLRREMPSPS